MLSWKSSCTPYSRGVVRSARLCLRPALLVHAQPWQFPVTGRTQCYSTAVNNEATPKRSLSGSFYATVLSRKRQNAYTNSKQFPPPPGSTTSESSSLATMFIRRSSRTRSGPPIRSLLPCHETISPDTISLGNPKVVPTRLLSTCHRFRERH